MTYSWFGQLLNLRHFFFGNNIKVADNVRPIPLVLLFCRRKQIVGVAVAVIVAAEKSTLPSSRLIGGNIQWEIKCQPNKASFLVKWCLVVFGFLTIRIPSPRQSISYFFLSGIKLKAGFLGLLFFSVVSLFFCTFSFWDSSSAAFLCFSNWNSKYFKLPLARWCSGSVQPM